MAHHQQLVRPVRRSRHQVDSFFFNGTLGTSVGTATPGRGSPSLTEPTAGHHPYPTLAFFLPPFGASLSVGIRNTWVDLSLNCPRVSGLA